MVYLINEKQEKKLVARQILEALPEWFGIAEAREKYISDSEEQIFFAAKHKEKYVGFLCLNKTGKSTVELTVMGVLKEYHRQGYGKQLFEAARGYAKELGYEFIQVKTVAMGHYDNYDKTNHFYQSVGFKEFEIIPTLWDEKNPCQIYIMAT